MFTNPTLKFYISIKALFCYINKGANTLRESLNRGKHSDLHLYENPKVYEVVEQKKGRSSYSKHLIILQVRKLKFKESKCTAADHPLSQGLDGLRTRHLIPCHLSNIHFILFFCFVLFFLLHNFIFFPFIFISWRLITLQYCSGFCHTLT